VIGKTISHYKIIEKLGEGGMGIVYKAEDTKLKRTVALKFLPPELTRDPEAKQRFIHEAQAASALQHNNVATIHEINETKPAPGEPGDGQMFICMDCYEGEILKDKIQNGPMKVEEAIDITIQVAEGLKKAHKKGIVHRDIKPANIFITEDGVVKILDFGLAKLAGPAQLTKTGTTLGTVSYMSPEQARGEEVNHRTDIWSLCVVLYEMVTEQLPFKGEYEQSVIYSILNEEPDPIIGVSMELDRIVKKALSKRPEDRYQNIEEIMTDLKSLRKEIENELLKKQSEKKSVPSIAVLPFVDMSLQKDQEYFCDGMAETLINALSHISELHVVARTSTFSFKGEKLDVREIGQRLNVKTVLEGSLQKAGKRIRITAQLINIIDGYHLWSEKYDRDMEDIFDIQDEISLAIVENLKVKLLGKEKASLVKRRTDDVEAYNQYLKGIYFARQYTTEGFEKANRYFEHSLQDDPNYAPAYYGLSAVCYAKSFWWNLPPKEAYPKARIYAEKALEIDTTLAEAHAALGFINTIYDWNWDAAERELKHALELNPNSAIIHVYYSWLLTFTRKHEEAIAGMNHAQQLDPLSSSMNAHAGLTLCLAGRTDESIEELLRTIEMNPNYFLAHDNLGMAYLANSMIDEAIEEFEKAVDLSKEVPMTVAHLAEAYFLSGNEENGEKLFNSLKERSKQEYVAPICFFSIHLGRRDLDQMFHCLERAYEEHDSFLPWIFNFMDINDFRTRIRSDPRFKALHKKMGLE